MTAPISNGPTTTRLHHYAGHYSRRIAWPGEPDTGPIEDIVISNREEDFVEFMHADVEARRRAEDQFIAGLVLRTGKVP